MMILKHIATGVSFLGAVCVLAAADFRIPAETLRGGAIAPPGVDQVDGELGNLPLEKFRAIRERFTLNFDSDSFPEHPETVDIGVNRMVFSGFRRASKAGYFISAPNALVGTGREKTVTASITFDRPVKAAGFVLQFMTGTVKVRFVDADGETLREIEQNGQGDPSGNGTWADYFVGFENSDEFGRIKKVEFSRSNLTADTIPEFSIDDLSIVEGAEPLEITAPEPRKVDVALLGSAGAANVAPQRPAGKPAVSRHGDVFTLENEVDGTAYSYTLDAAAGLASLTARTNGAAPLAVGRGWSFRLGGEPVGWKLRQAELSGGRVLLAYDWTTPTQVFPMQVVLSLSGGTLCLELASEQGGPVAIDTPKLSGVLKLSAAHDTAMRGMDLIAFLGFSGDLFFVAGTRQFYSYYVDWTKSNSTAPYSDLHYAPAGGKTAPLKETIAITLSDALPKVLPTIPNPVSPYRAQIAGSMVMEFWYGHFDELTELLEQYHRYGMDNLVVLMHRWQNAGFDRKYPSVMPPSPSRGGLESLRAAAAVARRNGQTLALHENYKDFYPDSPQWNEADLLVRHDGTYQDAWADSKELAPSKIRKYAEPMMNRIRREIGTNGCFLDVHSTHLPWWRVDFRPGAPGAGTMRGTLLPTNRLWQLARDVYGGPVFGESYALSSWIHSGNIDSVMGQAKHNSSLILDFLLMKIRPLATWHGAGYFERWNPRGYVADWQNCPLPAPEYARYSLQEVAFLTAPTMDDKIKREILPAAVNYYQKRRLVHRLNPQPVAEIAYYTADGGCLTSSEAVLRPKAEIQRLRETFADGSELYLNFSDKPWVIGGRQIEPLGFYASGPGFEAETGRKDGLWFDWYGDADGCFLNARNYDWLMEPKGTAAMGRGPEGAEPQFANRGDAVVKRGPLATDTAVAVMREADGSRRIRFFPQKQMGFVSIDLAASGFEPAEVVALDAEGNPVAGSLDGVERGSGTLTIRHRDPRVWSFRLTPGKGRTGR
ncbi:MAG: DUF5696 domain-containing protein [Victivallis sp.]